MTKMGFYPLMIILLLVWIPGAISLVPNQPPAFTTARSGLTPLLMYSFRQSECNTRSPISEDFLGALPLTMQRNATTCPTRNGTSPNVFHNAVNGVSVNDTAQTDALRTGSFGSSFSSLGTQLGIELWFSFDATQANNVQARLIEIGTPDGSSNTVGTGPDTLQLLVGFTPASSGSDLLTVGLTWNYSTTEQISLQSFPIPLPASFKAMLASFRTSPLQTMLFIALSISEISGQTQVTAHIGRPGQIVQSSTGPGGFPLAAFYIPSTAIMRIGCTRANTLTGLPGAVHFVAFYRNTIDASRAQNMLDSGFPNSNPAVNPVTFNIPEDITTFINLNQTNVSVFDHDRSSINNFRIKTLPLKGTLLYNGTLLNNTVMEFMVNDSSLLSYRALPDEFGNSYASFTFMASDNLCDSSTTPRGDANCNSPVEATATLNVAEQNDAPELANTRTSFNVFADSNNTFAFSITCRDRDVNTTLFGLSSVTFLPATTLNFGSIFVFENGTGACTNGSTNGTDIVSTSQLPFVVNATEVVASNTSRTWNFCYRAKPTVATTVDVGTDVIAYTCNDKFGASVSSNVSVNVKNALIAGCGTPFTTRDQWTDGVECYGYAQEDTSLLITLTGFDAVESHDPWRRVYKLATLPATGTLRTLSGDIVNTSIILPADNTSTIEWNGRNVSLLAGNLTLEFVPNPDYFNTICDLNTDPIAPDSITGSANCFGKSNVGLRNYVYIDGLNKGINGCNITENPAGCPDFFTFILGYNETNMTAFGDISKKPFYLYTVGVNDDVYHPLTNLTAPFNLSMPRQNVNSYVNGNGTGPLLRYADVDGDTYRIGFYVRMKTRQALLKCPIFDTPFVGPYKRLTWIFGDSCRDSGTNACNFHGKAYLSDLNAMFDCIETSTPQSRITNDTILITVYDPAPAPDELQPDQSYFNPDTQPFNKSAEVFLAIGTPAGPSDSPLTGALWAGIAAGLFFIAMSCFACIGCVISRAKRGEEAAVWVVKNILCTDVETRRKADISKLAAGGRRSLEVAIHAEHNRLARVVCCALFMRRVMPCLVKFDASELKVPDEEDMLQEAVTQTKKRIASLHRPKDGPIPVAALASEDVEDVVKEDVLADDSIFDWERHLDDRTGKVFYYNVKTHESRWTPPTVKVHEQKKITDRTSVKMEPAGLYSPKPPDQPKNKGFNEAEDPESDRTKKGN